MTEPSQGPVPSSREIVIEARVDADRRWVQLDPPRALIPIGGEVVWSFTGIPADQRPALLFESFVPRTGDRTGLVDPSRGPFGRLVRRGDEIRGSGSGAVRGEYSYQVCLIPAAEQGALVRELDCRGVSAGGLVDDPGPRSG